MKVLSLSSFEELLEFLASTDEEGEARFESGVEARDLPHGSYFMAVDNTKTTIIFGQSLERTAFPEDALVIAASRSAGHIYGRCYSTACLNGELGHIALSSVVAVIEADVFERARINGWRHLEELN